MGAVENIRLLLAVSSVVGLAVVTAGSLCAWNGWLDLKRRGLSEQPEGALTQVKDAHLPSIVPGGEVRALRQRVLDLERIAALIDL